MFLTYPSLASSHRVVVELDEDLLLGRSGGGISVRCKLYDFTYSACSLSPLLYTIACVTSQLFTGTNAPTSSDPNVTSTHSNSIQPAAATVPTNHNVHFASQAPVAAMAGTYIPSTTPTTPPNNNNFYQGTVQPAAMKPSGFSNSSPGSSGTVGSTPVVSSKVERQTSNTVSVLELPSSFPELEKLSVSQLQRLLVDSVALEVRLLLSIK